MWQDAGSHLEASAAPAPPAAAAVAHYGGPDLPPRALRNLLKAQVDAAPPGSEILWATYYFRDSGLAEALVAAQRRGVRVRVALDGQPRRADANEDVIQTLQAGLGDGLRVHRPLIPGPRLHAKIYAFSGPSPQVFVGSFNPSGDRPEDPEVLAEIGDQDRGHNLLVEFRHPAVVAAVRAQAERIWRGQGDWRLAPWQNEVVRAGAVSLFFFPRLRPGVVEDSLESLGPRDRVRAAISHLKPGPFAERLAAAARRGAKVELIVHDTRRRAPDGVIAALAHAGVAVRRYCHPDGLPMHAKFILVEDDGRSAAWFGSLNYNWSSRFLNQEILVRSRDRRLVARLGARFQQIRRETALFAAAQRPSGRRSLRLASVGGVSAAPLSVHAPDRACSAPAPLVAPAPALPRRIALFVSAFDWLRDARSRLLP